MFNSKNFSNKGPFNDVRTQEVRSKYRFNMFVAISIIDIRVPFSLNNRAMGTPVGRCARFVVLGFLPYFCVFEDEYVGLVKNLYRN